MPGTPGALTTDDVPLHLLYTEFIDSIRKHNEQDRNFKSLFCQPATKDRVVEVPRRSMRFYESGEDTTQPDYQHIAHDEIDLDEPRRMLAAAAVTQKAVEKGISSTQVRNHHDEGLRADFRLIQHAVLKSCLTTGGWYDGTMTTAPPSFKKNTFTTAHSHYLAANVAGVPTLNEFTNAKQHILEHGYGGPFFAFVNTAQAEQIENAADWTNAPGPLPTPLMTKLQEMGMVPFIRAAGVTVYAEDWIDEDYMLVVSLEETPCSWRIPEGKGVGVEGLMVHSALKGSEAMLSKYNFIEEYVRWVSCNVLHRGAGVAYYLAGAAWTDTTGWYI